MSDPLKGMRQAIEVGRLSVLAWPAVSADGTRVKAPVKKGDRFTLRGFEIEIDKVKRRVTKKQGPLWEARYTRYHKEKELR